jgi:CMP-N,N'-diacetyllegionaminic acid synthase
VIIMIRGQTNHSPATVGPCSHRDGVAYAITRECLLDQKSIKNECAGALVLEGNMVSIDTNWDLELAEYIYLKEPNKN